MPAGDPYEVAGEPRNRQLAASGAAQRQRGPVDGGLRAGSQAARVEILDATRRPDPKRRTAALVFTSSTGRPLRRTRFSDVWKAAAAAAGLGGGVTFHHLRHYYASLLIRHGESVKVVRKRWGDKSAVETLDTYSHLWPDSEDRTREAVDEVLGRAASGPSVGVAP
jgi:integrase